MCLLQVEENVFEESSLEHECSSVCQVYLKHILLSNKYLLSGCRLHLQGWKYSSKAILFHISAEYIWTAWTC